MRTTIFVDDRLGEAARSRAQREGKSLSGLVSRALEEYLAKRPRRDEPPPFRLITVGGGGPRPGIDLDRTSELLVAEDEATYGSADEET
jgi:hypothetical protein